MSQSTKSIFSSLSTQGSSVRNQPILQDQKPQPAPRTGSLRDVTGNLPKGLNLMTSSLDRTNTSIYSQGTSVGMQNSTTSTLASIYGTNKQPSSIHSTNQQPASVYSTSQQSQSMPASIYSSKNQPPASSSEHSKPNDFASLHNSIYAATQQRSALNVIVTGTSTGHSSTEVKIQNIYDVKGQSVYDSQRRDVYGSEGSQNSVDNSSKSIGQRLTDVTGSSSQSSCSGSSHSAILQSTSSVIGIGHGAPGIIPQPGTYSGTNPNSSQSSIYGTKSSSVSTAPYVDTSSGMPKTSLQSGGSGIHQGLLRTSQQQQQPLPQEENRSSSIVSSLTDPFAKQYPRPTMPAVVSDHNDNEVSSKHQNGGVYQNASNAPRVRRGSTGFQGFGSKCLFYPFSFHFIITYFILFYPFSTVYYALQGAIRLTL